MTPLRIIHQPVVLVRQPGHSAFIARQPGVGVGGAHMGRIDFPPFVRPNRRNWFHQCGGHGCGRRYVGGRWRRLRLQVGDYFQLLFLLRVRPA